MKREKMIIIGALMLTASASGYTDHRNAKVDSAEQVLNSGKTLTDKERMGCYYTIVRGTLGKDTKKHDYYCRQMLAMSYQIDAKNMRENALNHLGLQHYGKDEFDEAERYFLWAIAVTDSMQGDKRYKESDIDDNYSQLYGALGNLYNVQDKNLLAIEYYQKALPIFEKHGWLESQTILHHNVAELYSAMSNDEKAIHHYSRAIETGQQSKDSLMMALPRKGLVKIYISQGEYDKALATIMPAYAYYSTHRDEEHNDYAEILASMVKLHLMSGHENLAKAKGFAQEALACDNGELMTENRCDVYAAACMVAMRENNWQQALNYGLKSVHENDDEATMSDVGCYEMLANIYMHLGDTDKAQQYIKKVRAMMEHFATSHYQSGLSQMEVIYETEKKEAEIEQLQREKRWFIWGGSLTALVLLLTAVVFFLMWRSLKLRRRTALIEAKLEGELTERVRIARDLHDRMGGLLTAIRLNIPTESGKPDGPDASGTPLLPLVDEAIIEMRHVAHHLLPDSLSRYGIRRALSDYCRTFSNVSFSFTGEERHIAHEEAVYCIVHELVNNAVKSADAQHIQVQLMTTGSLTVINVSDDGKGFPSTEGHNGGIGLRDIRERVEALGGRLDIISETGKGTEINIEIEQHDENPQMGDCTAQ